MKKEDFPPALDEDLPTVQIPVGRKEPGLTIDREFVPFHELPLKAKEAYHRFAKHGAGRVYQCRHCGYLTTSKRVGKYKGYSCSNCGRQLSSSWTDYRKVYPPGTTREDQLIDIPNADPEDFPNTKAHLTKIKGEVSKGIGMNEMLRKVAEAVKKQREGYDPHEVLEEQEKFIREHSGEDSGKDILPMLVMEKNGIQFPPTVFETIEEDRLHDILQNAIKEVEPDWAAFFVTALVKEMTPAQRESYRIGDLRSDPTSREVHTVQIWTKKGRLMAVYDMVTGEKLVEGDPGEGQFVFPE